MKNAVTYNVAFGCFITLMTSSSFAQDHKILNSLETSTEEIHKRIDNYLDLKGLGYQEYEIFEDLGNANFLVENYETAIFWYQKLLEMGEAGSLNTSYKKRYDYALQKTGSADMASVSNDRDWFADVKADYQTSKKSLGNENYASVAVQNHEANNQKALQNVSGPLDSKTVNEGAAYEFPISVSADGRTAYFSKPSYIKPKYGVFSKKQLIHRIYKVDKVKGQWKNIQEIALSPKYYSAKHPSISEDGKRLFFASDMPGTFGKFDIYVSEVQKDGSFGIAKNLGTKVNTSKNDLYPQLVRGNTLCFASEGHGGFGGLDLFVAQVENQKVGKSVNLGSDINSLADDFSISVTENGMGYVMTNRGPNKDIVQRVAFTNPKKATSKDEKLKDILEILNSDEKTNYTITVFENE